MKYSSVPEEIWTVKVRGKTEIWGSVAHMLKFGLICPDCLFLSYSEWNKSLQLIFINIIYCLSHKGKCPNMAFFCVYLWFSQHTTKMNLTHSSCQDFTCLRQKSCQPWLWMLIFSLRCHDKFKSVSWERVSDGLYRQSGPDVPAGREQQSWSTTSQLNEI